MTALAEAPAQPTSPGSCAVPSAPPGAPATGDPSHGATPNGAPPTPKILMQIQAGPDGVSIVSALPPIKILELLCSLMPDCFAATVRDAQQRTAIARPTTGFISAMRRGLVGARR